MIFSLVQFRTKVLFGDGEAANNFCYHTQRRSILDDAPDFCSLLVLLGYP